MKKTERQEHFDRMMIINSSMLGLLTGLQGTYATPKIRDDKSLLDMVGRVNLLAFS